MQKLKFASILFAVLLLVGAGCSTTTPESTPETTGGTEQPTTTTTASDSVVTITKAEPKGDGVLLVEFSVPEEIQKTATSYRLLLSDDAAPMWPPTNGTWYELGRSHRMKEWKNLKPGKRFLRVCSVEKDKCVAYSPAQEVEVK